MGESIEYGLGEYRGRQYFIRGNAEPDYNHPEEFFVNVHYKTAEEYSNIEIALIDTEHGYTHFHQLYREHQPTKEFSGDFWDAMHYLEEDWRRYARLYWENHDQ